jgi:hypothetical protein
MAADVIGDSEDCGNGCSRNGVSSNGGAFRSFSGLMFKILNIKSNILNIKLDEEGGRRMGRTGRLIRGGEDAPLAPRPRGGGSLFLHCPSW